MTPDAIGIDALSDRMAETITADGVDISHLARNPHRTTGLYAIRTDPAGERHFSYWRDTSAARVMFDGPDAFAQLDRSGVLFLSGKDEAAAVQRGHSCAVRVIRHRGAIVPLSLW